MNYRFHIDNLRNFCFFRFMSETEILSPLIRISWEFIRIKGKYMNKEMNDLQMSLSFISLTLLRTKVSEITSVIDEFLYFYLICGESRGRHSIF